MKEKYCKNCASYPHNGDLRCNVCAKYTEHVSPNGYCDDWKEWIPTDGEVEFKQSCRNCALRKGLFCSGWNKMFKTDEDVDTFQADNCIFWMFKAN